MTKIKLKQINNEQVEAIQPLGGADTRPILGADIIPELYSQIFFVAKKKSGKTSCLFKILKKCVGRDTIIVAFVGTLHKDASWIAIKDYFEKKGNEFIGYTSLMEDGVNQLAALVKDLDDKAKQEIEEKNQPKLPRAKKHMLFEDDDDDRETKRKKTKYQAPEMIVILDDMSGELHDPHLITLLKENRHYKTKVFVSSQYLNDLKPASRKQVDVWIIFKGQPEKKLLEIHRDADISLPYDQFVQLYKHATKEPFSFLFVDTRNDLYRRNLSHEYDIPQEP